MMKNLASCFAKSNSLPILKCWNKSPVKAASSFNKLTEERNWRVNLLVPNKGVIDVCKQKDVDPEKVEAFKMGLGEFLKSVKNNIVFQDRQSKFELFYLPERTLDDIQFIDGENVDYYSADSDSGSGNSDESGSDVEGSGSDYTSDSDLTSDEESDDYSSSDESSSSSSSDSESEEELPEPPAPKIKPEDEGERKDD